MAKYTIRDKKQKVMKVKVLLGAYGDFDRERYTVSVRDWTYVASEEPNLTCRQAQRGNLSVCL